MQQPQVRERDKEMVRRIEGERWGEIRRQGGEKEGGIVGREEERKERSCVNRDDLLKSCNQ